MQQKEAKDAVMGMWGTTDPLAVVRRTLKGQVWVSGLLPPIYRGTKT